jgi:hypothetical protein
MVIAVRIGDDGSKRLTPFLVTTMAISTGALINGPQPRRRGEVPDGRPGYTAPEARRTAHRRCRRLFARRALITEILTGIPPGAATPGTSAWWFLTRVA